MRKPISAHEKLRMQKSLMRWYGSASRRLAWRDDPCAYKIWVSEIMAQQTRIRVMQPYFDRFIEKFPNVQALSQATLDEVLAVWSGLGYYRRAESLHRAARIVVSEHNGCLPSSPDQLMKLPGIGRYTAGAIASIAYGKRVSAVDGNVVRVLSRVFDLDLDAGTRTARAHLLSLAEELVLESDPGTFNQAMMELGALVCFGKEPDCKKCPLRVSCFSHKTGTIHLRPKPFRKPQAPIVRLLFALVKRKDGTCLMVKNPNRRLFGGLWQLPSFEGNQHTSRSFEKDALEQAMHDTLGLHVSKVVWIGNLKHILTHRCLDVGLYACESASKQLAPSSGYAAHRWVDFEQSLDSLARASLTDKLFALAKKKGCL